MEGMRRKLAALVENYFYFSYRSYFGFGFFRYPFLRLSMSRSL
jgi:hypothetical protein